MSFTLDPQPPALQHPGAPLACQCPSLPTHSPLLPSTVHGKEAGKWGWEGKQIDSQAEMASVPVTNSEEELEASPETQAPPGWTHRSPQLLPHALEEKTKAGTKLGVKPGVQ